eukprot:TRINITY_DN1234_c0_g2_i7.p2 TRINITY_DN1234_c0_g2~~TRINITY_DN1234_c0_g2_i7.p2  ORF type:complete len:122 (+),score=41.67 TRINITY_DN1234_c0_g2_i7:740-1105(+)
MSTGEPKLIDVLMGMKVKQLKQLLAIRHINSAGILEKKELAEVVEECLVDELDDGQTAEERFTESVLVKEIEEYEQAIEKQKEDGTFDETPLPLEDRPLDLGKWNTESESENFGIGELSFH